MLKIHKAVFPAAGIGSRFLPITKAAPKEMLPLIDRPLIQYVVEEAVAAGIEQLIIVTNYAKRSIEDYFDSNFELEFHLMVQNETEKLSMIKNIVPPNVDIVYVRQSRPLGLGDAVLRARSVVGDEPFAVLLADDIIINDGENCLQQMLGIYEKTKGSVLAVSSVPENEIHNYGIVTTLNDRVIDIVEKPALGSIQSRLAVVGRYILTPDIFQHLERAQVGINGEIQLTDAICAQTKQNNVYICPFEGRRFDCGSKLGFLKAMLAMAFSRPELANELKTYLDSIVEYY